MRSSRRGPRLTSRSSSSYSGGNNSANHREKQVNNKRGHQENGQQHGKTIWRAEIVQNLLCLWSGIAGRSLLQGSHHGISQPVPRVEKQRAGRNHNRKDEECESSGHCAQPCSHSGRHELRGLSATIKVNRHEAAQQNAYAQEKKHRFNRGRQQEPGKSYAPTNGRRIETWWPLGKLWVRLRVGRQSRPRIADGGWRCLRIA